MSIHLLASCITKEGKLSVHYSFELSGQISNTGEIEHNVILI